MKKLMMLLILIAACASPMFGQDVLPDPPSDWGDVIMNPSKWFVSFGAVAVLTAFVSAFLNGLLNVVKKFPRQLVAWLVGIVLIVGTSLLNFGYAAEFPIALAVIHGFACGLASNGVFDIPTLKGLLIAIEGWFKPKA